MQWYSSFPCYQVNHIGDAWAWTTWSTFMEPCSLSRWTVPQMEGAEVEWERLKWTLTLGNWEMKQPWVSHWRMSRYVSQVNQYLDAYHMKILTTGSYGTKGKTLTTGDEAEEHLLFIPILLSTPVVCEIRHRRRRRTFKSFHLSPRYARVTKVKDQRCFFPLQVPYTRWLVCMRGWQELEDLLGLFSLY